MPQRRNRDDLLSNNFTFEKVVNHIEHVTLISAAGSEKHFRIVHSDQSGQLMKSVG